MAGLKVVAVKTLTDGNLDLEDLRAKAEKHKDNLAAFMAGHRLHLYTCLLLIFFRSLTHLRSVYLKKGLQRYLCKLHLLNSIADVVIARLAKSYTIMAAKYILTVLI